MSKSKGRGRVAIYARVSTDGQTTDNQLDELRRVADLRGWTVVREYVDHGISGAKGRDERRALDDLLKDATRRRFDHLAAWSIDRLGRSNAQVATLMDDMDSLSVGLYFHKEGMDTSTPHGKAMLQMASVFAELERGMIRERVRAGLNRARAQGKRLGRPRVGPDIEDRIRTHIAAGQGIRKTAKTLGVGVSTVQRVVADQSGGGAGVAAPTGTAEIPEPNAVQE